MLEKCPKCGSQKFSARPANFEDTQVWFRVKCKCGYMWNEVFDYSHAEDSDTLEKIQETK